MPPTDLLIYLVFRKWQLSHSQKALPMPDDDMFDTICIKHIHRTKMQEFIHSRVRKRFFKLLTKDERRMRLRTIPRCALPYPTVSAWSKLWQSNNDQV